MNPLKLSKTHTTKFILPMAFGESTNYLDILKDPEFYNAYVSLIDDPDTDDKINMVYNTIDPLTNKKELDVVTKKVPDEWADDYVKLLEGKYSEVSEKYKQHLLNFWKEDKDSFLYAVLYKEPERFKENKEVLLFNKEVNVSGELWPPPNISREIYGLGDIE